MWKNIVCAVDFGEPSRAALEQAAELARFLRAELTIVHAVAPPPDAASDVLVSSRGTLEVEEDEEEGALEAWRAEAETRAGRPVRARLLSGDAAAQIARMVREGDFDLVVVGTHGRTGLRRAVMGSVAERIVREAPCAVLVAHDGRWHAARAEREEISQYL